MFPTLVRLGPIAIPTYGVLLAIGIGLSLFTAGRRARLTPFPPEAVVDVGLWIVLGGLAGAKLLLVVTDPSYLRSFSGVLSLLRAGGVFYGGLAGAVLAAAVLLRRYRLPFFPVADVLIPSVALGHFFGRLGCFSAGCCFGRACSEPWAVVFTNPTAAEISGTPLHVPLHPTQLYEAFFNLCNYVLLAWLFRRRLPPGAVLGTYLITYGTARFVIEFFRGDVDRGFVFGGLLSTSQLAAAIAVPLGVALVLWAHRRHAVAAAR
jgi:phosphatidylglycerol:prolipoprotein diacylglycerol transferase